MTYNDTAWGSGRNQDDDTRCGLPLDSYDVILTATDTARVYASPAADAALASDLQDLTDLALGRYSAQWAGTARGGVALAEIARRENVADGAPTRYAVTEHIRHGNYRYDLTETATTLLGAVYAVLVASPYASATPALADRIAGDLFTTGHAEHGWSTFER